MQSVAARVLQCLALSLDVLHGVVSRFPASPVKKVPHGGQMESLSI